MDTVVLDGTEYLKASSAAKQFGYTPDYIGQLCRGKKVDARLVGRTWFVNPDSLVDHKKSKYSKQKKSKLKNSDFLKKTKTISVVPVIKNKTMKSLSNLVSDAKSSDSRKLKVKYELDDESLLPTITKRVIAPPKMIRIEQADAQKVKVNGKKKTFNFKPSALPEVSMSGQIDVKPVKEDSSDNLKNIAKPEDINKKEVDTRLKKSTITKPSKMTGVKPTPSSVSDKLSAKKIDNKSPVVQGDNTKLLNNDYTTIQTKKTELKFSPESVAKVQNVKISTAVIFSPLIATVLALVIVTALFSASSKTLVSESSYHTSIVIQVANLLEVLQN